MCVSDVRVDCSAIAARISAIISAAFSSIGATSGASGVSSIGGRSSQSRASFGSKNPAPMPTA